MFARIRSGKTWSPSRHSRAAAARPRVRASASESAVHSACHRRPRARARARRRARTRRVRVDEPRAGAGQHRTGGIALVRHRRGAAAFRLGDLADLRLREQDDVEADLRRSRRNRVERAPDRGDRAAVRVPRDDRLGETELRGERGEHLRATVAERSERAGRAAELRREGAARAGLARVDDGRRASRRPSRRRSSAPPAGAASGGHRRRAVLARRAARTRRQPVELRRDQLARHARETSIAAVSSTSWLVAPKWTYARRARRRPARRSARTSGSAGLPTARPRSQIASTS